MTQKHIAQGSKEINTYNEKKCEEMRCVPLGMYVSEITVHFNQKNVQYQYHLNSNPNDFKNGINTLFFSLNSWVETNLLSLNYSKTHYTKFMTKTNQDINLCKNYNNNQIKRTPNTKFLGPIIDNTLSWKARIEYILPKLSTACDAIRFLR
jgi:hypothetical protein